MRPKELRSGVRNFVIALLVSLVAWNSAEAAHDKIVHNFIAFPHGASPQSNFIADAAGSLYGTTYNGGTYGFGTVFGLMPSSDGKWNQVILYSFSGGRDDAGGFDGNGTLFELSVDELTRLESERPNAKPLHRARIQPTRSAKDFARPRLAIPDNFQRGR
jgi:uncharacterized repeat protein (TIGR03803 family)